MGLLAFSHTQFLATGAVPMLLLRHAGMLSSTASGLLVCKAAHLLVRHARRSRKSSTMPGSACGAASKA